MQCLHLFRTGRPSIALRSHANNCGMPHAANTCVHRSSLLVSRHVDNTICNMGGFAGLQSVGKLDIDPQGLIWRKTGGGRKVELFRKGATAAALPPALRNSASKWCLVAGMLPRALA